MDAVDLKKIIKEEGLENFGKFYGIYRGQVHDNEDPDFRGRLMVICPAVSETAPIKKWADSKGFYATKGGGMYFMPQKGDPVWVQFEGGNPDFPIWEYGWFPNDYAPDDKRRKVYTLQSPAGHRFVIDEDQNTIFIQYKDGKTVEVNDGNISLGTLGGSAEPAVLGETLKDKLESLIDILLDLINQISAITVNTAVPTLGTFTSAVPNNVGAIAPLATQLNAVKSQLQEMLSGVVTLD